MRISTVALAAALAVAGSAFAAQDHDPGSSSSSLGGSTHQLASNFTGALHKIGAATRQAWQRADARLHRMGKHDNGSSNG
jgi:hypothetical protein